MSFRDWTIQFDYGSEIDFGFDVSFSLTTEGHYTRDPDERPSWLI